MHKSCFLLFILLTFLNASGQQTINYYLSGTDKDHTVEWDFFCNTGHKSGSWTKIPVPSNWEMMGFGNYYYGHDKNKADEQGIYKMAFDAPALWKNKNIFIVFEGVMTDAEVTINDVSAGPMHQGGFYQFRYDITSLVKFDSKNQLQVKVNKQSSNKSVNRAEREGDFWALGGIFRPVYLEIVPETYIENIFLDPRMDGSFILNAKINNFTGGDKLEAQVQELNGTAVGKLITSSISSSNVTAKTQFANIKTWNPETPNLYQVIVSIRRNGKMVHSITKRFGFRTAELREQDGFYVNNVKVVFKGVCRHSSWPETGRTLSKQVSISDVKLMKEMNMNAVRMSHYPPDQHFLDVCDSLGIFVIDELTGWQAAYDTVVGKKLVKEFVQRDINHPSIVIWSNGNEGGWNRALDADYSMYDPQHRLVIHPWERFNGTDTKHYPDYNYVVNSTLYGNEVFFPTEFMHGLYDGGHAAGLQDFWTLMEKHPYNAGAFLWVFADEGIVRTDMNGIIDTHGNNAPDGILGPHREKEASYYAIKEIWSPVSINMKNISSTFDGRLTVENKYLYTNLNRCSFKWKLVTFPSPTQKTEQYKLAASGNASIALAPGEKGFLKLNLPANWQQNDALYLTVFDAQQNEINTWSWPINSPASIIASFDTTHRSVGNKPKIFEQGNQLTVTASNKTYYLNTSTGFLDSASSDGKHISISGGPSMAAGVFALNSFKHYESGNENIIETSYNGDGWMNLKWIFADGQPVKLEYSFSQRGEVNFMGLTFNYPEEKITGMKWLGRGPYRVWKNRMQGMQLGVWEKAYNNTITGESWIYPEFKGYHADTYWVVIQNKEKPFTIFTENSGLFFQMLKPEKPKGAANENTSPPFPAGNLGFLHAIPPIGTKFQPAERLGPQSQKNIQLNYTPVKGVLWFEF